MDRQPPPPAGTLAPDADHPAVRKLAQAILTAQHELAGALYVPDLENLAVMHRDALLDAALQVLRELDAVEARHVACWRAAEAFLRSHDSECARPLRSVSFASAHGRHFYRCMAFALATYRQQLMGRQPANVSERAGLALLLTAYVPDDQAAAIAAGVRL